MTAEGYTGRTHETLRFGDLVGGLNLGGLNRTGAALHFAAASGR
jgi:hypothetical protein